MTKSLKFAMIQLAFIKQKNHHKMPQQTEEQLGQNMLIEPSKYQLRLEGAQKIAGYDNLSDESKQAIAHLAFDKDLDIDGFNHLLDAELGSVRLDAKVRPAIAHIALDTIAATPEVEARFNLPKSFEEASRIRGHSIEDFVQSIDFEVLNGVNDALDSHYSTNLMENEMDFLANSDNVVNYEGQLIAFAKERIRNNPYQSEHKATMQQVGWLQLESRASITSRVEDRSTDPVVTRIYLNPELGSVMPIYQELFKRAEAKGLRFKSKVLDYELRNKPADRRDQALDNYSQKITKRSDPIVFYAFEDSKDELLEIANDVYKEYAAAFEGQATSAFPLELAEGYAIGAEPEGLSGNESLSSHRREVLSNLIKRLASLPKWSELTNEQKQKAVATNFRRLIADKQHINADNLAFNS